jgi:glyoxylase-like metal-dependent hydrolase (beta-lactamase superfamily II)
MKTSLKVIALSSAATFLASNAFAQVNEVQMVAPNVFFHQGEITKKGHCNNGWIILEDYVVVIDANFPSGAKEVIPKIKALTQKPIRFTFDTHHHGDHAYANQLWHEAGSTPVAHLGAVNEMRKYERSLFPEATMDRWTDAAKNRKDVAESKLKAPTLLFSKDMVFDDGKIRVELLHFGVAHTHGDGFAWLPNERILFTGDACVNGAYNYTGDGNIGEWIKTLKAAQKLNPKTICPGHGPKGGPEILEDQIAFFETLMSETHKLRDAGKTPVQAKAAADDVRERIQSNERIRRYVGLSFASQLEKAWTELGGEPFPKD